MAAVGIPALLCSDLLEATGALVVFLAGGSLLALTSVVVVPLAVVAQGALAVSPFRACPASLVRRNPFRAIPVSLFRQSP